MANKRQALQTLPRARAAFAAARELVLNAVSSPRTRTLYAHALTEFERWMLESGNGQALTRATVQAYRRHLETVGGELPGRRAAGETETRYSGAPMSASSINLRLSAIRKLARVVADVSEDPNATRMAEAVARVESLRQEGSHVGNWLTLAQAGELVNAPDVSTLAGMRDRALLALLVGAGLRRAEAVALELRHLEQREGRWAIVNMRGKRNKERTIPIAPWVYAAIDAWTKAAGITSGRILRTMTGKGELSQAPGMSTSDVYRTVTWYAKRCGYKVAPHDLRRTFARLALAGGAPIDQISGALGHSNVAVTGRYIGSAIDYTNAPSDRINIRLLHRQAAGALVYA